MKKVLCIAVILVCVLLLASAAAEEFTIRNGIRFGMTKEQVFAIESDLTFEELNQYETITRYCADGTFEGYENGRVFYVFDDNALVQVVFHFESSDDIDYLCSCFETREQMLNERYGSTDYTSATGRKMEGRELGHYHRYLFHTTMSAYSQRVLKYNDCAVCIDNYVDVVDFQRSWSSCEIVYTAIYGDMSGLVTTTDMSGNAVKKEQPDDSDSFVFRNGITWGMKEEEVVAAEGQYTREHRDENTRYLYYDPVQFSIVQDGILGYAFSNKTGNLIALWYVEQTASDETTETLQTAYRTKYGEELEADSAEFNAADYAIFGDPNEYIMDSLHKWAGPAGTQIWMVKRNNGNLIIFYYSPELIDSLHQENKVTDSLTNWI